MASSLLPDGYRYLKRGEIIQKDDRYWSWRHDEWRTCSTIIGAEAKDFHVIRKITGDYLPKTESGDCW